MDRATILVNSCDSYEDTWFPFFELLKVYWFNCSYPIVLNTESKKYCDDALNIECLSLYSEVMEIPYGKRLRRHLKYIDSKYVIMMMDDFFLRSPVDQVKIENYLNFLDTHDDVAYISFDAVKDIYNFDDGELSDCLLRPKYGEYKVNLQAGIWRRDALLRYVKSHESPWEFETKGSIRSFETFDKFYTMKDVSLSPINYGKKSGLTWGIVRGKWVKEDVIPLFEEYGIVVNTQLRGYFDEKTYVDITVQKNSAIRDLKSYGIVLWLKMRLWGFIRLIRKILHLDYDIDWVAYKRRQGNR